ncbi:hypothetical protein SAMCCGM7_pC0709 (plasmid) [Sinorhizobium americanum CCGM7]|nr:hypothetical protein SAMCCGM7_pC0709 [Sinorhizobium americanum CCGM7]
MYWHRGKRFEKARRMSGLFPFGGSICRHNIRAPFGERGWLESA